MEKLVHKAVLRDKSHNGLSVLLSNSEQVDLISMWSVKAVGMWHVRKVMWSVQNCEWLVALVMSVHVYLKY